MKIIFLDADGTLFHHEGYIPPSAIEACQLAQKNGHKICLCTGRQMMELYSDLLKIDYDAIISGAGAHVEINHKTIYEQTFDQEQMHQLVPYFIKHHIPTLYESSSYLYCTQDTCNQVVEMTKKHCKNLTGSDYENHGLVQILRNSKVVDSFYDQPINKITFLASETPFAKIKTDLEKDFDVVPATFAPLGKESGEVASYTMSKATGMEMVLRYWKEDPKDTIAIGDGFNDLCMFEYAQIAVAMGNADQEVQKKADWTTSALEENGIQLAFKKLHLI